MRLLTLLLLTVVWFACCPPARANAAANAAPTLVAAAQIPATTDQPNVLELEKAASTPYAGTSWSIFNHRGSGLFVLLWGITALLVGLQYPRKTWLRFVPPLALFGLVEFLLLRNDPMTWPLGPIGFWLSMRSPEVFQHRIFILIILGMGITELLRAADRLPPFFAKYALPLLALTASILILFHRHEPAMQMQATMPNMSMPMPAGPQPGSMEASMAIIKRQHALLAAVGFGFVVTKLLADTGRLPTRLGNILWPAFAIVTGLILMGYTE
jgi:hypothetical protein